MSMRRFDALLEPALQLSRDDSGMDAGPWTDQELMHDRAAVRENSLTLFPLFRTWHQLDVQVHSRRPDFDNEQSHDRWAHVVECSWTPPADPAVHGATGLDAALVELGLPAEPCRFCWRLGWFDPDTMADAPWGALRAELHIWPARPQAPEVLVLWDGEAPELPPPPQPSLRFVQALEWLGCLVVITLALLVVALPLGMVYLLYRLIKLVLASFNLELP